MRLSGCCSGNTRLTVTFTVGTIYGNVSLLAFLFLLFVLPKVVLFIVLFMFPSNVAVLYTRGAAGVGFCSPGISSPYFLIACTRRRVWEKQKTRREREKETEAGEKDASEMQREQAARLCAHVHVREKRRCFSRWQPCGGSVCFVIYHLESLLVRAHTHRHRHSEVGGPRRGGVLLARQNYKRTQCTV